MRAVKKLTALLLAAALLVTLAGCGGKSASDPSEALVTLTLPVEYVGEDMTQEQLEADCADRGFTSVTLNDDGSATYVMTEAQHADMLSATASAIDQALDAIVANADYCFTSIDHNDDFTEITAVSSEAEPGMYAAFAVLAFYTYAAMYAIYAGGTLENCHVLITDADGNVLQETNSRDMAEAG